MTSTEATRACDERDDGGGGVERDGNGAEGGTATEGG